MKYIDPTGRDIHIKITNKIVGTGYLRTYDADGNEVMAKVPIYQMTVYDDATKKTLNYAVTRHAVLDKDDKWLSDPKKFATYEPKGKSKFFKGMITLKSYGQAIELRDYNKTGNRGELYRSDTGDVNTALIEIHIGGNYMDENGVPHNVTSFGCFSLQGDFSNEEGWNVFITDICNKLDYEQNKHIIIEVQAIE